MNLRHLSLTLVLTAAALTAAAQGSPVSSPVRALPALSPRALSASLGSLRALPAGFPAGTSGSSGPSAPARLSAPARVEGLAATQQLLGYIETDSITYSGAMFGTADTYPIGAVFTSAQLASYKGCRIVGLRIATATEQSRTRTFIYQCTNDATELTPVVEQRQRLYPGWNNVFFNGEGIEITGRDTLFFGYDYVETEEMAAAEQGGICLYGDDLSGSFFCYHNFGQGLGLYSLSGGRLCVQLIVDISALPAHDMDLIGVDAGFKYKMAGEGIDLMATVMNVGREPVTSYRYGYAFDDAAPRYHAVDTTLAFGRQNIDIFSFNLPADIAIGAHTLTVFLDRVSGEQLPQSSINDTIVARFAVYEQTLDRHKVYVEVYNDQTSAYASLLNPILQQFQKGSPRAALVNVHMPTTQLAIEEAAYLHDLYAYTTPSFTFNRSHFPGEPYIAYDVNYYLSYIGLEEIILGIFGDMAFQDLASPTFANLDLSADYEAASRTLSVTATGLRLPEAEAIYGDMALTLLLIEDGVKGTQRVYNTATGRTTVNRNYSHNQVLRHFITAPLGDPLSFAADGRFQADYRFTLPEDITPANAAVVGLLTKATDKVTAANADDYDVIDCNSIAIGELLGLDTVRTDADRSADAVYSLDGRRISVSSASSVLPKGVYIKRSAEGRLQGKYGQKFIVH